MHNNWKRAQELRKLGQVSLGTGAVHGRLKRARGKASGYICECGAQAQEWSQVHDTDGSDLYGHFNPMCRSCHRRYDTYEDTAAKISASLIGNKCSVGSPGNRDKRTEAQMAVLRAPRTEAQMEAVRRPKTDEAKSNMSAAKKGKPWSEARRKAWERNGR